MNQINWHIVYTRPQFEQKVYDGLKQKGIESFFPTTTAVRQWSDRKKKINVPLFPGYVFVKTQRTKLHETLYVKGTVKFVSFSDEIATISEDEIERIKKILSKQLEIEVSSSIPTLSKGEKIFLNEGPFAGQTVQFIEYKGNKRGAFHFESIEKYLIVNIPLNQTSNSEILAS